MTLKTIARIHSDFPEKFGIPRQSNIIDSLKATIVFEPEYRNADALRGLEGFSHIWLIWGFSMTSGAGGSDAGWSPTVRPPRLGGNARAGVFATRSPNRPNPLGLSSVGLERIEHHSALGSVLHVTGADLLSGTPIYDIKPYLPYTDSHVDASGGFAQHAPHPALRVICDDAQLAPLPNRVRDALPQVLAHDPRPRYQNDPQRVYGMTFAGFNVRFTVADDVLTVLDIARQCDEPRQD